MPKKYEPIIKEGTHLAESHKTEGAYRGILLDDETNQLAGQAEWTQVKRKWIVDEADICLMALVAVFSIVMTLLTVEIVHKIHEKRHTSRRWQKILGKTKALIR